MDTGLGAVESRPDAGQSGKRKVNRLWSGLIVLAGLAFWFANDLVGTLAFAVQSWGLAGIADAVLAYRLGEALVVLPLAAILLVSGRDSGFLSRWHWVMWVGALLSGVAYLGLAGRIVWAPLALIVAGLGLLLPWRRLALTSGCAARAAA